MNQPHLFITLAVLFLHQSVKSSNEHRGRVNVNVTLHQGEGRGQIQFLREFLRSAFKSFIDVYTQEYPDSEEQNWIFKEEECVQDLFVYSGALQNKTSWALRMADSTGSIGPGVLKGNFELLGDPDECLGSKGESSDGHVIEGDRCVAWVPIPNQIYREADIPESLLKTPWIPSEFSWHLCLPKSCRRENLTEILNSVLKGKPQISHAECREEERPMYDVITIVAICYITLIILLNVIGTFYDVITVSAKRKDALADSYCHEVEKRAALERGFTYENELTPHMDYKEKKKSKCSKFLTSFSIIRNTHKIFQTRIDEQYRPRPTESRSTEKIRFLKTSLSRDTQCHDNRLYSNDLSCIHGIRVISMALIILGHTILTLAFAARNRMDLFTSLGTLPMQAVINSGYHAVDTFFLISGCLVSFLFLREIEKNGRLRFGHILKFLVHRWWRLTPLYISVIAVFVGLSHLFTGPQQDVMTTACNNCKRNWWVNLLYINNIYRNTPEEICLGQSWFLSVDMQFHWVAPLALVPLATGWIFLGFLVIAAFICTHIITNIVFVYRSSGTLLLNSVEHQTLYYFMPYCRVGVFAVGIALAYLLHKNKSSFLKSKVRVALGWMSSIVVAIICILITVGQWSEGMYTWSKWERVVHEVISRPAWSLCVSWAVYACCLGSGDCVNSILSWRVWRPLGRLSYGAFLLHLAVLTIGWTHSPAPVHFSTITVIHNFIYAWVLSYMLAYIFSVLVEMPCISLEKHFTKREHKAFI